MKASDADRDRAAEALRHHFGAGRLTDEELALRVDAAYEARTEEELEKLTNDLPALRPASSGQRRGGYQMSVRIHATVFVAVNVMLIAIWALTGGGYFWPIWSILGWGVGLAGHAAPLLAAGGGHKRKPSGPPRLVEERRPRSRSRALPHATSADDIAASVASEQPSLRRAAAPDGTVTILFSDIEGSTAHNERLGDVRWLELLQAHNRIVRAAVAEHNGYEVKSQGDGFMIAFPSARRAIECARAIQATVASELGESHADGPVRVRIGLHTGEALRDESDFYGKNVVVAARITDQARGGEILVSAVVKQLTESAGDLGFESEREVELAGLAGMHAVYRVV